MSESVVKILALQENQDFESTLFILKKGWTVRFTLGSSLYGQKVRLFTNYPEDDNEFKRDNYRELEWKEDAGSDSGCCYLDVSFRLAGTFRYYYHRIENPIDVNEKPLGSGYLTVQPTLEIGDGAKLSLSSIQCQTVLTKCMGSFESWKDKLEVARVSGYNMIHFTPIQELGASNSAYSLKDQLKLNPIYSDAASEKEFGFQDVAHLVEFMRKEWNVLSITDIVLNHTANETPWLMDHPEATYNLKNSPHFRPAYLLDRVLWHVTLGIADGKHNDCGLSQEIATEDHLSALRYIIKEKYLPQAAIHEMFLVDVEGVVKDVEQKLAEYIQNAYDASLVEKAPDSLIVIQDEEYRRNKSRIDINSALKTCLEAKTGGDTADTEFVTRCSDAIRSAIVQINCEIKGHINMHLDKAVDNVISAVRYERLANHGPRLQFVSKAHPLVPQYFTYYGKDSTLEEEEALIYDDNSNCYIMAHNGWVMGDDPLKNFAERGSNVYIRRELIAWGDSVKLRYGAAPEDCPFLWSHMKKYVEETVKIFHGIRLDNCHSTPIHVAEYLIDAARKVRPDLYLIAELFTASERLDNIFVNRLGITSLIRESLAAYNSHELGRFIHRFGGDPTGSFIKVDSTPLKPSMAGAIMFDLTHDNESPVVKRSAYDLLPTAALIAMSTCATGSNRGYDEIVPHHIHVVNESRPYAIFNSSDSLDSVSLKHGIIYAKKVLNSLHTKLDYHGYSEIFVDQVDENVVAITRHNPVTHKSVVLIARTSFNQPHDPSSTGFIRPINIPGKFTEVLLEMKMKGKPEEHKKSSRYINGYTGFNAVVKEHISVQKSEMIRVTTANGVNEVVLSKFTPGSVVALDVSLDQTHLDAIIELKNYLSDSNSIKSIVNQLSLDDLNYALFRIDREERDEGHGGGTYAVPNFRSFTYCGLAGLMYYWRDIRTTDDLGHPICGNLRDGNWLPDYVASRLLVKNSTKPLGAWLKRANESLVMIPRYLIPRYFDLIIVPIYSLLLDRLWELHPEFVQNGSNLVKLLTLGSTALVGFNPSSPLPPLSNNLTGSKLDVFVLDGIKFPICATIPAGFPHFASGFMRNWGRDTFIALRGMLLLCGRYADARNVILGFAGVLRHGLIPNLLDKGTHARYNCRDAVWWWLQCIKEYCTLVPCGETILKEPVRRLYPKDDDEPKVFELIEHPLEDVIQEALQRHFAGIDFVERNAGSKIDAHMKEPGFHITVGVKRESGLVFGGNEWNCGTWMDKMGSSDKAGNRGKPSSPRDGSAVELIGLCKSVVSWLNEMHAADKYAHKGVHSDDGQWTWSEWADLIQSNFEKLYWVGPECNHPLVNQRGIYKDTAGATHEWQDFQLRPNFLVTMTVAPELFDESHARAALQLAQKTLVSKLGVKTLDPSDWNYRGDYHNSNDSDDYRVAHGFNYHQGPEWLWLMGYYLRAWLTFSEDKPAAVKHVQQVLTAHYRHLESSVWFGLPELTNSDGKPCHDSCHIQAWSHGTLLEVLYDVSKLNNR